jgi:hypothetical protein
MGKFTSIVLLIVLLFAPVAYGKKQYYQVVIADPYIELHTGPAGAYPIFHVVDRGEMVDVMKRRTDWFKVRTDRGVEGWVSATQMSRTLEPDGRPVEIKDPVLEDYTERRREVGLQVGDFDGANIITAYGAYLLTKNLSGELSGSHITGDFSDGWMVNVNIVHQPFPKWRVSPFLTLGTGIIHIDPKSTLVSSKDRTDQVANVGIGFRTYLGNRFLLRAEYKSYQVFLGDDDNEVIDEWKAGFSFFF